MSTLKQRLGKWLIPRLPVSRRTFDILRFELNALLTRALAHGDPRTLWKVRRLSQQCDLRVNLGSGGHAAEGWVNVDVRGSGPSHVCWDIRKSLPFSNGSVGLACASHIVEHLDHGQEVPGLLNELLRVLKPGGRVRIVVPDAARYLEAYVTQDPGKWAALGVDCSQHDASAPMAAVNHVFHQGGEHQFGYDFETLSQLLIRSGFAEVTRSGFRESRYFDGSLDPSVHAPYSLYVEATRPRARAGE